MFRRGRHTHLGSCAWNARSVPRGKSSLLRVHCPSNDHSASSEAQCRGGASDSIPNVSWRNTNSVRLLISVCVGSVRCRTATSNARDG